MSSLSRELVLNGANSIAVLSNSGVWEIIQFQRAELMDTQIYKLSKLLRGQLGTEDAMASGAAIGKDVVLINQALEPLKNSKSLRGIDTNWRVGPSGYALSDPSFTSHAYTPGYRGALPYSPVHLRAKQMSDGDLHLVWHRRDRLLADDWTPPDIPMSETEENYLVVFSNSTSSLTKTTSIPSLIVDHTELQQNFGSGLHELELSVAQFSSVTGPGVETKKDINITV